MKSFRMFIVLVLLFSGLLVFGTSTARAGVILGDSDTLTFNFGNQSTTISIDEGKGECVGCKDGAIEYTFIDPNGSFDNPDGKDKFTYLVESGATKNADGSYTGFRSDKITMHVDHGKEKVDKDNVNNTKITITLNSDQKGNSDEVTGFLEMGLADPLDITSSVFSTSQLSTLKDLGIDPGTVKVLAASDLDPTTKVPEPATMLLFGLGLLGVAAIGRNMRSED